ncbi:MAG: flavin reductase family protein [Deinococcales bacterium]
MDISSQDLPYQQIYKILTATIIPRPIAWVSTADLEGRPNVAPYSFFNAVCANPPHLLFCAGVYRQGLFKDSYNNVKSTGEFVVNIVTEELAEAMNLTAAELPAGSSEFDYADLTPVASKIVKAPRVKESPVHFECKLKHIYEVGDWPGAGSVVIGEVVQISVDDSLFLEGQAANYKIDNRNLKAVGRLAGNDYIRTQDVFSMIRPK